MKKTFLITVSALALSACNFGSSDPVNNQFSRQAGAIVDEGGFGYATLNNVQLMSGEKRYTIDLAHRFASEVESTVNFAFNSATLDHDAMLILQKQAHWIHQFPEVRFRVFGHTDLVGSASYNKSLGMRRARAVVNYLAALGIDKSRLEAVISEGETMPLIPTEDRERQNRRTVTEVSGFVERAPQLLDGNYAQVVYREYVASAVPTSTLSGTTTGTGG